MLEFNQWLSLLPNDLEEAKRQLTLALIAQNSKDSSGMDLITYIEKFKDSLIRCANKAEQNSNPAKSKDIRSFLNLLRDDADAAISEPDLSLRRYLLSGIIRKIDSETNPQKVSKPISNPGLGDISGHYLRPHRIFH